MPAVWIGRGAQNFSAWRSRSAFRPSSVPSIPLPTLHAPVQSLGTGTAPCQGRPAPIRSHDHAGPCQNSGKAGVRGGSHHRSLDGRLPAEDKSTSDFRSIFTSTSPNVRSRTHDHGSSRHGAIRLCRFRRLGIYRLGCETKKPPEPVRASPAGQPFSNSYQTGCRKPVTAFIPALHPAGT
jgi:hypothetical protein